MKEKERPDCFALIRRVLCLLCLLALLPYPHPAAAQEAPGNIRVLLRRLNLGSRADLTLECPYLAKFAAGGEMLLPAGAAVTVISRPEGLTLYHAGAAMPAGKKLTLTQLEGTQSPSGLRFNLHAGLYPGDLTFTREENSLQAVLSLPVETYLLGVVPYEMGESFPPEALKVQAVCARTYALNKISSSAAWDVVDTTNDQVFRGLPAERARTEQAVSETAGLVLTWQDRLIPAWYSASNGGQTELPSHQWEGREIPGCFVMQDDPWDEKNPASTTRTAVLSKDGTGLSPAFVKLLKKALSAAASLTDYRLGEEDPIRITGIHALSLSAPRYPEPSRLMTKMTISVSFWAALRPGAAPVSPDPEELNIVSLLSPSGTPAPASPSPAASPEADPLCDAGMHTVQLDLFPDAVFALGLSVSGADNELIRLENTDKAFVLTSGRFGHGVGMSQRGAEQQALEGRTFREILNFYYPGAVLRLYSGKASPLPTPDPVWAADPGPAPTATPRPTLMPVSGDIPEGAWIAEVAHIDDDSSLNLRQLPSPGAAVLMRLYKHQRLLVLEDAEISGWVHVKTDAAEGYVMKSFLKEAE